jgi:hypothetical protein
MYRNGKDENFRDYVFRKSAYKPPAARSVRFAYLNKIPNFVYRENVKSPVNVEPAQMNPFSGMRNKQHIWGVVTEQLNAAS